MLEEDRNIKKRKKNNLESDDDEIQNVITNIGEATINYAKFLSNIEQMVGYTENTKKLQDVFLYNDPLLKKLKDIKSSEEDFQFTKKDITNSVNNFKASLSLKSNLI